VGSFCCLLKTDNGDAGASRILGQWDAHHEVSTKKQKLENRSQAAGDQVTFFLAVFGLDFPTLPHRDLRDFPEPERNGCYLSAYLLKTHLLTTHIFLSFFLGLRIPDLITGLSEV